MACQSSVEPVRKDLFVAYGADRRSEHLECGRLRLRRRVPTLLAATASILLHATAITAVLFVHATRHPSPNRNRYIYITLTSPRAGVAISDRKASGKARSAPNYDLPIIPRPVTRLHHAVRRARRRTRTTPGLAPTVIRTRAANPTTASVPSADTSKEARFFARSEGGGRTGLHAGGSGRQSSGGSVSAIVVSQPPTLLSRITPVYPERARTLGIQGQVVLRFVVDQSGRVEPDIKILSSIPMLDEAAIEAVRQWRFAPARDRNGSPVRVLVSVPLQFSLR